MVVDKELNIVGEIIDIHLQIVTTRFQVNCTD